MRVFEVGGSSRNSCTGQRLGSVWLMAAVLGGS